MTSYSYGNMATSNVHGGGRPDVNSEPQRWELSFGNGEIDDEI